MKGLGRLWAIGLGLASATTLGTVGITPANLGCQTHACDPSFVCIDKNGLMVAVSPAPATDGGPGFEPPCTPSTQGVASIPGYDTTVFVDGNTLTWDTSLASGPWLDYPGNRTYIINFPDALSSALATGQSTVNVSACISADNPADAGTPHMSFICGADYVAEFSVTATQLTVLNASCAGYSLRIEVQAQVTPTAAGAGDAGAPGDAGTDAPAE